MPVITSHERPAVEGSGNTVPWGRDTKIMSGRPVLHIKPEPLLTNSFFLGSQHFMLIHANFFPTHRGQTLLASFCLMLAES